MNSDPNNDPVLVVTDANGMQLTVHSVPSTLQAVVALELRDQDGDVICKVEGARDHVWGITYLVAGGWV